MLTLLLAGCTEYGLQNPHSPRRTGHLAPLPGQEQEDRILQVVIPALDILWVIDDSCSMSDNQFTLIANFPAFVSHFVGSGLDYHIGVTRTTLVITEELDPYNLPDIVGGKLEQAGGMRWIDETSPNPESTFGLLADVGIGGSHFEMGRGVTYYALGAYRDTINAGFMRPDASIHTIVVSDEPDITPNSVISLTEFIDWYDGIKQSPSDSTFSSIVKLYGSSAGWNYASITNAVGGVSEHIEGRGWGSSLDELGVELTSLTDEFFLSRLPVEETISVKVEVEGVTLVFDKDDWDYLRSRNSIVFREFIPDPLSVTVITYTLASSQ